MMLRTLFQNWGLSLQASGSDWLQLLTGEEFAAVVGQAGVTAPSHAKCENARGAAIPHSSNGAGSPRALSAPPDHAVGFYLETLSPGFDERARALRQELEGQQRIACVA